VDCIVNTRRYLWFVHALYLYLKLSEKKKNKTKHTLQQPQKKKKKKKKKNNNSTIINNKKIKTCRRHATSNLWFLHKIKKQSDCRSATPQKCSASCPFFSPQLQFFTAGATLHSISSSQILKKKVLRQSNRRSLQPPRSFTVGTCPRGGKGRKKKVRRRSLEG